MTSTLDDFAQVIPDSNLNGLLKDSPYEVWKKMVVDTKAPKSNLSFFLCARSCQLSHSGTSGVPSLKFLTTLGICRAAMRAASSGRQISLLVFSLEMWDINLLLLIDFEGVLSAICRPV